MHKIAHTVTVEAPVEQAFKFATNWQAWEDWFVGFSNCSLLKETEICNGAICDYKFKLLGVSYKLQTEIQNFEPNKGWNGIGVKGVPHKTTWIFEDLGNRTNLTYIAEYSLPIPVLGPIFCYFFANPEWSRILRKSLENFGAHFQG